MLKAIRPVESRAEYGLEKFVGFAQWEFTNRTYIIRQCDEKSMVGLIQSYREIPAENFVSLANR